MMKNKMYDKEAFTAQDATPCYNQDILDFECHGLTKSLIWTSIFLSVFLTITMMTFIAYAAAQQ